MATLSTVNPTLLDLQKRLDPDGSMATIVEILNQELPILDHVTFVEGNLPTGHRTTVRTGIPAPTWRKLYGGVQPTKSTTAQVTDNTGNLEAYAEIDAALAELNGMSAEWMMSESKPIFEGFAQEMASTLIYGNEGTAPEEFTGLAPRFNALSASVAQSADNVVSAGGVGSDNTSIWLICWSPNTVHGIVPKGSKAGLQMENKGKVTIENADGSNGRMEAYRTHYKWSAGLTVRDWRYIARVCNIDVSDNATDANAKNLIRYMIKAAERIPNLNAGRMAWYCNRTVREYLRLGILEKVSSQLNWETVEGKRVMTFDDIPVYRLDAILNTETAVT